VNILHARRRKKEGKKEIIRTMKVQEIKRVLLASTSKFWLVNPWVLVQ
jgi:hypothetical protein